VLDTGQFLPDTAVLARVDERVIRVERFVDAYFASLAQVRPAPDSLGRVEFLDAMINKEILALTALAIERPFGFEDRQVLREHTDRVLSNVLYQRAVLDSVAVTEDDIVRTHAQFGREQRYLRIRFADPNLAAAVRRALLDRKLTWNEAVRRHSKDAATSPDGDIGWVSRASFDPQTAMDAWDLKPGEISPVVRDLDGFNLLKLVERRPVEPPALEPMRSLLRNTLQEHRAALLANRLQAQVAARIGMAYDTTNIRWAAAKFQGQSVVEQGEGAIVLNLGGIGGDLEPADTARVLARHRGGRYTLGEFLHTYNHQPPIMRQPVGDFESFRARLDAFVLEPHMAEEAKARGLEGDSLAKALVERKVEELRVEHLFQDSVLTRVWISPADRRRYYDDRIAQFITYPVARFAAIVRDSKAGADSVVARLRAGERAADILHADSLRGVTSGSIQERQDDGRAGPYHKLLFGELRPGQTSVQGPDRDGTWLVLQLIDYDPGRQLPYEEVQLLIDESLQNIRAEEMLKALIARHRKRLRIETHPELVMRIRLSDPSAR
jgi:hypothetical protein